MKICLDFGANVFERQDRHNYPLESAPSMLLRFSKGCSRKCSDRERNRAYKSATEGSLHRDIANWGTALRESFPTGSGAREASEATASFLKAIPL